MKIKLLKDIQITLEDKLEEVIVTRTISKGTELEVSKIDNEFFELNRNDSLEDLFADYIGKYLIEIDNIDYSRFLVENIENFILNDNDFEVMGA